jgi:integrase
MGRTRISGIYQNGEGRWCVDKWYKGERFRNSFETAEDAKAWLVLQLEQRRRVKVWGERPRYLFDQAAARYLDEHSRLASIEDVAILLAGVMPYIGQLYLDQVHDETLRPFVQARLKAGRAPKTINLALSAVRRVLNLAARKWRDDNGKTWLEAAPLITMLPLIGEQREPRPITWAEQRQLLPRLPDHLARMALFDLQTGARDAVVCGLRWEWEIPVPELGISVFEVPRKAVKGQQRSRILVCNSVAQSIIESVRDEHPYFVFVYSERRKRRKPGPVETMNNTAWQRARQEAGLADLHVHDLRHTVGMRLREAGVREETIADILWHNRRGMTAHYSMAQIVEIRDALELITDERNRFNKSLSMLVREKSPPKVPIAKNKRARSQ